MAIRVGINGFGRIGRNIMRAALGHDDIDFVAVNDITDAATLAHLLKYDSVHGKLQASVEADGRCYQRGRRRRSRCSSVKDPAQLPWKDARRRRRVRVDRHVHQARRGREAPRGRREEGASSRRPPRGRTSRWSRRQRRQVRPREAHDHLQRLVHDQLPGAGGQGAPRARSASCKGWMTTIHSYTNDQNLLDLPHKDLRRARAAGAVDDPDDDRRGQGRGRGDPDAEGQARRVRDARADAERVAGGPRRRSSRRRRRPRRSTRAFKAAADGPLKGILEYIDEPLVSIDFSGNPHSSIVDAALHQGHGRRLRQGLAWYDNEWGYSYRCVDLLRLIAKKGL